MAEDGHTFLTYLQLVVTWVQHNNIISEIWSHTFGTSSASGYMGEKYFQEFGLRVLGAYSLTRDIQGKVLLFFTWPDVLCSDFSEE